MKKKILIVTLAQHGYNFCYQYYSKYLSLEYEVTILCMDSGFQRVGNLGANIKYINRIKYKVATGTINGWRLILKTVIMTHKESYDYLIIESFKKTVFFVGLLSKAKINIIDIQTGNLSKNKFFRFFHNFLLKVSTFSFDYITILNNDLAKYLHLDMKKILLVPLGSEIFSKSKKIFKDIHLVYLGVLDKRDIHLTIEGLYEFYLEFKNKINIKYDIIGPGSNETITKIMNTIDLLNLHDIVKYHGRKKHNEIGVYFDLSNIGVCFVPKTEYFENQPSTKIIEYGLSGLLCIATSTKENMKMINQNNGVLCEDNAASFYNALLKIHENHDKYFDEQIRDSFKNRHWSDIIENHLIKYLKSIKS